MPVAAREKPLSEVSPSGDGSEFQVDGRRRVVIEHVRPEVDGGRFPVKRVVGQSVIVEADVFADGHDEIAGVLRYRHEREEH